MPTNKLENVPASDVPNKVKQFIELDDATNITLTKNSDGTWTITAQIP